METDRWDQLAVLFEQAQALAPGERAPFLDEACGGDADLRAQLEALLGTDGEAKAYFENLAGDVFAPMQAEASSSAVRPAQRTGHYEVLEKLGGGGMGVVYKAHDTRLDRYVALKFLPPALSADELAMQRFVAEAKAASALDHANICTIHEIGETDDGQLFIAMACYQGETLKRKIQQGPLPVEDALDYAVQIARGLSKAHSQGIIHRDIKPANVMVTDDGAVKILDFGLAKIADVQLTKTGTTMGTVAYMSPEQSRGHTVDHRTDIWSLGVVFHEMLTGERPFRGDYEQAIIYSILHEEPPPITALNPNLPPDLEHVVTMCLEKERDLRYAAMDDLQADLEVFVQGSGTNLSATVHAARRRAVTKRRRLWAAAAGVLLVLMVLAFSIPVSRTVLLKAVGAGSTSARTYVAVLPLTSNNPDEQALADGLMQSLTRMIARLETDKDSLWVVPAGEILQRNISTAQEARKVFGVTRVLRGELAHSGATMEVILNLEDPVQPRIINTITLPSPSDPAFQEEAMEALARLLDVGLDAQTREAVTPRQVTSPDAYAYYLQGMGYLERYDLARNLDNAILLFGQAIAEDSLYAPAYAGLCDAYWEQYQNSKDMQWVDKALQRCHQGLAIDDQQAAIRVTLGRLFSQQGDFQKAEQELQRALELEPNNTDAYRWLGWNYNNQGQTDKAEDAYKKAIDLKPDYWLNYSYLGTFYFYQGRFEEAADQYQNIIRLTPDNYIGYNNLGIVRLDTGDEKAARTLLERSIALKPNDSAFKNLGRLYFRNGQYALAAEMYEEARALKENDSFVWRHLGNAYFWAGDSTRARLALERFVELARQSYAVNPNNREVLSRLAESYMVLGNETQSRKYLDLLFALMPDDIYTAHIIARVYEMLGQRALALHYVTKALEGGLPRVRIETDPWLTALREDQGYQSLLQGLADTTAQPAS